jgi:hypothetical protein
MRRAIEATTPTEAMPSTVLFSHVGTAGETKEYKFTDSSVRYFETVLKTAFQYTLFDNVGTGLIRVSYNRPYLEMTEYTDGAKTLRGGDSFYVEEAVWYIKVYFIENSTVELVLKSTKDS